MKKQIVVQKREEVGRGLGRLRQEGWIPGVVYGKGYDPLPVKIGSRELTAAIKQARTGLWELKLDVPAAKDKEATQADGGGAEPIVAVVQDVQTHYLTGDIIHLDFHRVTMGEASVFEVPISLVGQPKGVKEGGVMEALLRSLDVRCTPDKLPEVLEVDVSGLEVGQTLHVSDLILPEGVEAAAPGDESVVTVTAPRVEEPTPAEVEAAAATEAEAEAEEQIAPAQPEAAKT